MRLAAGAVALATMLQLVAPASATPPPAALAGPAVALTSGLSFASWAHPRLRAEITAAPSASSSPVARIHLLTEEGLPEVYLLLEEITRPSGTSWVKLRIPGRPNGRVGWVPRAALGSIERTEWGLRVNVATLRATLYHSGSAVWRAPIGVGAASTPTPLGQFWVRELLRVGGDTLYGPYAFGTSDYSVLSDWPRGGVVGIHGTNEPALIPGRPSHGCIRMRNPDIVYLAHHLPIGAPVDVVG